MPRTYFCDCCFDDGWVSHRIFWCKVCPKCNGDPKSQLPPKPEPPFSEDEGISFRLAQVLALQVADGTDIVSRLASIESKLDSILRDVEEDLILNGNPNAPKPEGVIYPNRKGKK